MVWKVEKPRWNPHQTPRRKFFGERWNARETVDQVNHDLQSASDFEAYQLLQQSTKLKFCRMQIRNSIQDVASKHQFSRPSFRCGNHSALRLHSKYRRNKVTLKTSNLTGTKHARHRPHCYTGVWGYVIFFGLLFLIFPIRVFAWAQPAMDLIDELFTGNAQCTVKQKHSRKPNIFDLITQGIIPGIGGIVIFIPELHFCLPSFPFWKTGYMARVVFDG